jgi:hypothetical protein
MAALANAPSQRKHFPVDWGHRPFTFAMGILRGGLAFRHMKVKAGAARDGVGVAKANKTSRRRVPDGTVSPLQFGGSEAV